MSGTVTLAIPASDEVQIIPSVLSGGGSALDLSGLMLTTNWRVPVGTVQSFPSQTGVSGWFGPSSQEAALATTYFNGFDGSTKKPGAMLFAQYPMASVGAWLLGGSVASEGMSLAQLQALNGTINVTIDGAPQTSSPIDLSSATSFSNAAELMNIGLGLVGATACQFTGTIALTTMTVSNVASGAIAVGQEIRGNGAAAGTIVSGFLTGSGGIGTYTVSVSQSVGSGSMTAVIPTVQYDATTGAFMIVSPTRGTSSSIGYATGTLSTALNLTAATGALISQGAAAAVPASFMANVVVQTQNWASFATAFDPDNGSGNANKVAFAKWTSGTSDRYAYIAWDTDVTPTLSLNAVTTLGNIVQASSYDGTAAIYSPTDGPNKAAFVMGAIASVDFTATNGRVTMKFRSQAALTADVNNQTVSTNLQANTYNFYGVWGTANELFTYFSPGQISGKFKWIDSYINQIWLNNQLQLAAISLLTQAGRIPYNQPGYGMIRAAFKDPINQAINFGAIVPGVSLSAAQAALVNAAAGVAIDTTLTNQGWYLQVLDANTQVRAARQSPPCNLWYMDGEAVQKISLASVLIQ